MKTSSQYQDLAMILAWPDATIRGDEAWMMFFKKIGFVKNLNFKVGHTGIILIERNTGELHFYDFGRYIAPRGYGRARSKDSDPKLTIKTKAQIDGDHIVNLLEIVQFFEEIKDAMQGVGDLYFSIVQGIDFYSGKTFADQWVHRGSYPYGAVALNANNCSRFIARLLLHASRRFHFWHSINFPETIKASPMSNLVNASPNRSIYKYTESGGLEIIKMNRYASLLFLLKKLRTNICSDLAGSLPEDITIGGMVLKDKPGSIPTKAQYLGGVGEGAWFYIEPIGTSQAIIHRFTPKGKLEYIVLGKAFQPIDFESPYQITYDSHFLYSHILQANNTIKLEHICVLTIGEKGFSKNDRYA
ncbi:hypothetical protein BWD42_15410 [Sphingobacterium sp. CZ-UAM]|uniref:DUF6695 family protein n=1 Tax=Sphingobacterium sp. CZ-UAM TaxID=1933868 RepID=UPI0009848655|nr:DUF6695 family protein [Sphingobacterium sp. CZ-UAM]OOG17572.1 hypothetical protein BWD42_15410 [Sphingobacterium sp. CZ-UAM]